MGTTLDRTTFQMSRVLEFFSEKELQMQIGFASGGWPIALLKELIDNALDACETAGILPDIEVTLEPHALSVRDNGPGLPLSTLERSLDYLIRVSDKAYYVSPSRGQLGNALKCVWAAPYVACRGRGRVEVTAGGVTHRISITLDRIAEQPTLHHHQVPDGFVKTGTLVKLCWPGVASYLSATIIDGFYKTADDLIREYAAFNPHGSFTYQEPAEGFSRDLPRTTDAWHKWTPRDPTSAHWYTAERLRGLIRAYIADERRGGRARTVRDFVSEFAGLSSSAKQKQVTEAAGLSRAYLRDLVADEQVSRDTVSVLLSCMQEASRPVKPAALGVLGEAHVRSHLCRAGADPESIQYRRFLRSADDLPVVLELAFAWMTADAQTEARQIMAGINWTPSIRSPFPELPEWLGEQRLDEDDPVIFFVHLAMPRPDFTDRGKSMLSLPAGVQGSMAEGVLGLTKHWKTMKHQTDRDERVRRRQMEEFLKRQQPTVLKLTEAVAQVMEEAYLEASAQGRLPANARQVMYAARPKVLALTGGKCWKHSSYFTQVLLPNYMTAHPDQTASWDVVFDDRGHLVEPHTDTRIGLGTLAVRRYLKSWHADVDSDLGDFTIEHDVDTVGPGNRYQFALYIEKEGFDALMEAAQLAARWDLMIFSSKGQSVVAARTLVEALSAQGVRTLVVHDFDKSGIEIMHTLRTNTRRYSYQSTPLVIDLGLRLTDVLALNLQDQREHVDYPPKLKQSPAINLEACGATAEECAFLVRQEGLHWVGDRVELNALHSDQFIAWLEEKFAEHGVQKVVPDDETLIKAYQLGVRRRKLQRAIDDALSAIDAAEDASVPEDLAERIRRAIDGKPIAWDEELWRIVKQEAADTEDSEA